MKTFGESGCLDHRAIASAGFQNNVPLRVGNVRLSALADRVGNVCPPALPAACKKALLI